jgi:antitoxin ParD1/3/4
MNVSLTPELESLVKSQVSTGLYNSSSEVIREALRMWRDEKAHQQRLQNLRERLAIGEAQADAGEYVDYDLASIKASILNKYRLWTLS